MCRYVIGIASIQLTARSTSPLLRHSYKFEEEEGVTLQSFLFVWQCFYLRCDGSLYWRNCRFLIPAVHRTERTHHVVLSRSPHEIPSSRERMLIFSLRLGWRMARMFILGAAHDCLRKCLWPPTRRVSTALLCPDNLLPCSPWTLSVINPACIVDQRCNQSFLSISFSGVWISC